MLNSYFRSRKYIGSKDRKFISNTFWNILKHRFKIQWHLNKLNLEITYEREIILEFFFLSLDFKDNIDEIKRLFILKYRDTIWKHLKYIQSKIYDIGTECLTLQ